MKELQKIQELINIEKNYSGNINPNSYIIILGVGALSTIRMDLSSAKELDSTRIFGIEYRLIDCIDPFYITVIHRDLIGSILREVDSMQRKVFDSILHKGH